MKDDILRISALAAADVEVCDNQAALNDIRVKYLGKKGEITSLLKNIGRLSVEEKKEIGAVVNKVKTELTDKINAKRQEIEEKELNLRLEKEKVDFTLPSGRFESGRIHPISIIMEELEDAFAAIGFELAEGPEIETVFRNFDALNTPKNHTSRDLTDTFYLNADEILLRCHTSTVQVQVMEKRKPPIRIISMGKCYRNETPDATHGFLFHQIEGLCVDKGITFSDLKGTLDYLVKKMFGSNVKTRFRPHFFPFTEPSAETDISCIICGGKGCNVCKNSGWIELGGAGMVDTNVLREFGIDTDIYSGFAFGWGLERVAMLRYGINNIKLFYKNDLRFLKQFKRVVRYEN